jgi:hypothetical protein
MIVDNKLTLVRKLKITKVKTKEKKSRQPQNVIRVLYVYQ